ncbi:HAD family hydrolase [Candidatus Dependentiae bacterium]|nr:MAG: HAD family hydrolase [Candidatus Dependentiae bacterium]
MSLKNDPQQQVIIFDLDDTLIQVNLKAYLSIAWKAFPRNIGTLMFLKSSRAKDKYGNKRFKAIKTDEFSPGGAATSFAFYGLYVNNDYHFQQLIPELLKAVWDNAVFMTGANTLLAYLKQKGYAIVYATNKDYTSYKHVAESMDAKYKNAFSMYPTCTLVTHPTKISLQKWKEQMNNQSNLPEEFKQLVNQIIEAKPDQQNNVYFADGFEKPQEEYYTRLISLLDSHNLADKEYIFFDDKPVNIEKAKQKNIKGHVVKNVADIVKGLEKEGVLDPNNDRELYEQLEKEGVFGFIKKVSRYFIKS